jgi:hypothetical protein
LFVIKSTRLVLYFYVFCLVLYVFLRDIIFEEKIKLLNRAKRFAGLFWPVEAGRPIEKHGLRVDYYKIQGFFFIKFSMRGSRTAD